MSSDAPGPRDPDGAGSSGGGDTPESSNRSGDSEGHEGAAGDSSSGEEGSGSYRPRRPRSGRRPGGGFRIPAWVVVPLAAGAGFLTAEWPGAVFGLVVGIFLWRIRSG